MMADRQQKISGDLDYAEKSRKDADALAAKRQEELQHSQADAVKIVNQAGKMARNSGNHWSTLPTRRSPR